MNGHGNPPPPPTRTTTANSCLNRFLSSITLVALGAIGGFSIFHSALQYRIDQTQHNHNATLEIVTGRFVESEKQRKQCIETNDGRLQEISDLRGRLDSQINSWYDLTAAQRSVVTKQRENTAHFREVNERDQLILASLKAESDQKDRDLDAIHGDLIAVRGDLQTCRRTKMELESELIKIQDAKKEETNDLQVQMKHKDIEIEGIYQSLNQLSNQKHELEKESRELQLRIRQKDEEIKSVNKNSGILQNQKKGLEQYVADMKERTGKLESQIVENDRELFKYRKEEGELETKLVNFREGMLGLLKEKIHEIQDLEKRVDSLNQEKASLEMKLENWREGMLELVKEKLQEIDQLKSAQHKSDQAESEELISDKTKEIKDLKLQIERDQESTKEEIFKLESDLAEARKSVEEKTNQIDRLKSELGEFVTEINDLNSVLAGSPVELDDVPRIATSEMMIDHIRQRDGMICRQLFGKGPYYVKFEVRLPPTESNAGNGVDGTEHSNTLFFVIELSSRKELPHSTYTFLTLVESNLYNNGVAFLSTWDDGGLRIASSQSPNAISLEQKLKPLGLTGGSSLSFVETFTSDKVLPCGEYSFGFVQRGPGLNLFLSGKDDNETNCFANVIRGQENLQKIKSLLLRNGEPMEIIMAKHLRVD